MTELSRRQVLGTAVLPFVDLRESEFAPEPPRHGIDTRKLEGQLKNGRGPGATPLNAAFMNDILRRIRVLEDELGRRR